MTLLHFRQGNHCANFNLSLNDRVHSKTFLVNIYSIGYYTAEVNNTLLQEIRVKERLHGGATYQHTNNI